MKRVYLLFLAAFVLIALEILSVRCAYAAKIPVSWILPTNNDDGSALTDLKSIRIEWGSCNGTFFGVTQASIIVPGTLTSANVYPTGLTQVCIRAYAINENGVSSAPSKVVMTMVTSPGKPVTLGQPISLPPKP